MLKDTTFCQLRIEPSVSIVTSVTTVTCVTLFLLLFILPPFLVTSVFIVALFTSVTSFTPCYSVTTVTCVTSVTTVTLFLLLLLLLSFLVISIDTSVIIVVSVTFVTTIAVNITIIFSICWIDARWLFFICIYTFSQTIANMACLQQLTCSKCFGGLQKVYSHQRFVKIFPILFFMQQCVIVCI